MVFKIKPRLAAIWNYRFKNKLHALISSGGYYSGFMASQKAARG
jgi:hypothetical protein